MEDSNIPVCDYPFVSPCGKELNFVRPAATPIVFHAILKDGVDKDNQVLLFGASLEQFYDDRHCIAVSAKTGRLYHKLTTKHSSLGQDGDITRNEYGLIRSSVAVTLSEKICSMEDDKTGSGLGILTDKDEVISIPFLNSEAEPGPWAMPYVGEE